MIKKKSTRDGRKVAIVHDWLTGMRGGEKVLEAILEIYDDAEIFTIIHIPASVSMKIESRLIHESFISKLPLARKKYRYYLTYFPAAIESFNLNGYDLIISISHCVARGAIPPPGAPHLCYINTPMRYAYDQFYNYFSKENTGKLRLAYITLKMNKLRIWDQATHMRVDAFAANSEFIARRVKRCYGRDSDVVYPPVDTDFYSPSYGIRKEDFYLIVSALEPYKRLDIAIDAFNTTGRKLVVAGTGSSAKKLKKMASKNIEFTGWLDNEAIRELYRKSCAFIFPGTEDFGMTPVEAQACGTPVVAYAAGGALETVIDGKTGVFFEEQTPMGLNRAIDKLEKMDFNQNVLRRQSMKFSKSQFRKNFERFVKKHNGWLP